MIDAAPGDLVAQRTSLPFEQSPAALVGATSGDLVWLFAISCDRTKVILLSRRAVAMFYSHTLAGASDDSV